MKSPRYLFGQVQKDLQKKMVFLAGPRQVGKTTLAKKLLSSQEGYLNWDDANDRERILDRELPVSSLWVFDEIHKYRGWRNYLKGLFDKKKDQQKILVTGSAKLDLYRYGGDSLQGRYHFLRLHPLSLAELGTRSSPEDLADLFKLGGFPEPFFGGSSTEADRWSIEYRRRLVREEISGLEQLHDLTQVELLVRALPQHVGSPLSINSLREDLSVAHKTMAHWLDILERVYSIYRVPPFGAPRLRAVKKEQKHYHLDWNLIKEDGPRFENLVANHLLKWIQYQEDVEGKELELRYFRDIDGREVDFVVMDGKNPTLFLEVKLSESSLSPGLKYLSQRFPKCPAWQIHFRGQKDFKTPEGIRICPAHLFLRDLV